MQAARVGADQTAAMLSDEGARLKAAARTADADATAARAEAAQVDGSTPKSTLGVPQGLVPLEYLGVTVCTPGVPREYSVGPRFVSAHRAALFIAAPIAAAAERAGSSTVTLPASVPREYR